MVTGNGYQSINNSGMGYSPNVNSSIQRPVMNNWYNPNNQLNMTNWYNPTAYSAPNQQNSSSIFGRVVNDESEIMPNEVPMDGSISIFPKSDGSEVIIKSWAQNGTISTMRYVPVIEGDMPNQENNPFSDIIDRLDRIEKRLNTRKNNNHTSYKKEASNDSES